MCARLCLKCWKGKCRKRCKSIKSSHTGTRSQVSCVRGKYANHLHRTGLLVHTLNIYILIQYLYMNLHYNIIQNTSHLSLYLPSDFKAPQMIRKYVLLFQSFLASNNKPRLHDGVNHQHMEHIFTRRIYLHQRQREVFHNMGEWHFHWKY